MVSQNSERSDSRMVRKVAQSMPLARTIWKAGKKIPSPSERFREMVEEILKQGESFWPVSDKGSSWGTEKEMDWDPCVYFYAGQVIPKGRSHNVVLLYHSDLDQKHPGNATPCDSGGVYNGKCHPFTQARTDPDQRRRAKNFLRATNHDVARWRGHFADFLVHFFQSDWQHYLYQYPPKTTNPGTANPILEQTDFPARYPGNWNGGSVDWRSWTWEVRIENDKVSVTEDLAACFIRPNLRAWLLDNDPRAKPGGAGASLRHHKSLVQRAKPADNPPKAAREWMIREIAEKLSAHGTP